MDVNSRKFFLLLPLLMIFILALNGCAAPSPAVPSPTVVVAEVRPSGPVDTPDKGKQGLLTAMDEVDQKVALLPETQDDLNSLDDLTHYSLSVDIDYGGRTFEGQERIELTNTEEAPLERLYFRLLPNGMKSYGNGSLTVTEIAVDDQPVLGVHSPSDTVLEIELPEPLEVGESVTVKMDFQGVVPEEFGGRDDPAGYGIFNYSDGVLALSGWYPILAVYDDEGWNLDAVSAIGDSVYSDTATYAVDVSVNENVVLASTGVVIAEESSSERVSYQLVSGPVRDFFLVMSTEFEVVEQVVDGTQVQSYYLPGHKSAGEAALSISADSLNIFNDRFGAYPYAEFKIVDAPMRNALGVEYPGIVLVASQLYDDPDQPSFVVATAHEVAHQWWYNLVGNDVFDEPWLDEALATYSSSLYYQEVVGEGAYQGFTSYWEDRYDEVVEDGSDASILGTLAFFEDSSHGASYSGVVYTKGALFFKALREKIGDRAFFGALQEYYRDHKYGIARGEDLLSAFEESSGESLRDFYQQWLYSP
jgi:aminopeptidase N